MRNKEKIYFLLPNLGGGGVEKIITSMSFHMKKHEVNFVLFEDEIAYPFQGKIHILNIQVGKKLGIIGKAKKFILAYKKLKKFKKDNNVKIMMSFMPLSNFLNALTKTKEKTLISVRANPSLELESIGAYRFIYKILTKYLYSKVDKIIVISKSIMQDLIKNFKIQTDKIEVIYNPIDIDYITSQSNEVLVDDPYISEFKNPVIITVGRLVEQKGQWHLIRVFAKLKTRIPNIKLFIIGEGHLRSQLTDLAKSYGLNVFDVNINKDTISDDFNYDVYFLGFQNNPHKYIKHSMLYVFPSLYEGFGNVITEAMACETPVVSADCMSGPREIISPKLDLSFIIKKVQFGEFGVLLPSFENPNIKNNADFKEIDSIWVNTIEKLLKNSLIREKYKTKGLERIHDFSIHKITPLYEQHFRIDND